jgi:hypothetical protein
VREEKLTTKALGPLLERHRALSRALLRND